MDAPADRGRQSGLGQAIVRNTAFVAAGRLWTSVVSIFLVPYIVAHIGLERFGVWAMISVLIAYAGLVDLGVGYSFTPHIAKAWARGDVDRISRILGAGVSMYSVIAVPLVAASLVFADPLARLLDVPAEIHREAVVTLVLATIVYAGRNVLSVFESALNGVQRMDLVSKVNVAVSIPGVVGTVLALEGGYGLPGLVVVQGIMAALAAGSHLVLVKRVVGTARVSVGGVSWEVCRELFRYGAKLHVSNLSAVVNRNTDKFLLSYFVGPGTVGLYELGSRIVHFVRSVPLLLASALLPAAADLEARSDGDGLAKLYVLASKIVAGIAIPLGVFLFVNSQLVITSWMGAGYERSSLVIQFLIVGYTVNLLTAASTPILRGMGRVEYEMRSSVLTVVANILLSFVLILRFGLIGALVGTSVALIVGSCFYLFTTHGKVVRWPFSRFWIAIVGRPMLAGAVAALAVLAMTSWLTGMAGPLTRVAALGLLFAEAGVFAAVYTLALWKLRHLEPSELAFLRTRMRRYRDVRVPEAVAADVLS